MVGWRGIADLLDEQRWSGIKSPKLELPVSPSVSTQAMLLADGPAHLAAQ